LGNSLYTKRPEGCRNSSRVFAQTFGTVHNISQVNLIMPGLKNDETPVEKLYEDYKWFVKSILLFGNFLHAAVKFIHGRLATAAQVFEISLPAAQESHRDHGVADQDHEDKDQ
jgi:hypothetical protein